MLLRPQRNFTVVRQIANHVDTATYYVRAVIRNAYTDAVIETLDLTNRGGQRFSKNWQVPVDPSGQGFEISIVTSVYIDSGYTTKSDNYGDEETSHIIEEKENVGRGGSGGVDSRTIRRILQEELAKTKEEVEKVGVATPEVKEPVVVEKPEPMRFDEVLSAIKGLNKSLKPEKVNLTPVVEALGQVLEAIAAKEVTPATDLTPLSQELGVHMEEIKSIIATIPDAIEESRQNTVSEILKGVRELMEGTQFTIAPTTAVMTTPKPKEVEPIPFDLTKLSS